MPETRRCPECNEPLEWVPAHTQEDREQCGLPPWNGGWECSCGFSEELEPDDDD